MITIKLNFKGQEQTKEIPTSWNDLTFRQYLDLLNLKGNETDIIALFTGLDKDLVSKAKIEGLAHLLVALEFLKTAPEFSESPTLFMDTLMPEDITFHALAPYQDCRSILAEESAKPFNEFVESYAKYCAIYVHAVRNDWEGYDYDIAMSILPEVMNQPAREVVGLGSVFISKLLPLRNSTQENSQNQDIAPKKSKQDLKS